MDFHNMKRKQLQALCKKHKISANLTNLEMANNLYSLLKGKEEGKRVTRGRSCLKRVDVENVSERESDVVNRKVKKVRFSPENETFEFVRSDVKFAENKRGRRQRSVLSKVSLADEIVKNVIDTGRFARSSGKKLESGVVETKKGRRGAKNDGGGEGEVLGEYNVDVVDIDEGEGRVNTRRSLRNKGKMDEGKRENVGVDLGKRRGKTRNIDQGNAEGEEVVLEIDKVVESQKVFRRSERNVKEDEDSTMLSANANENEVVGKGRSRRTKKAVVIEACKVEIESKIETEVNTEEGHDPVLQAEEPENVELRRNNRRKSVIPSLDKSGKGKAVREKENILQLEEAPKIPLRRSNRQKSAKHTSELQIEPDFIVSTEAKKISELHAKMRRSERKTGSLKSATMTNETIENNKLLKQSRESPRRKEELQIRDDLRRSKRNVARDERPATREGKNGNVNAAGEKEPSKQRRDQNVEEEAAEIRGDPVERVPKQSIGNASRSHKPKARVSPAAPNQPLEQSARHDKSVALNSPFTRAKKESFLVKGSSCKCHEEPGGQDGHVDFQDLAERATNAASSNTEVVMDNFAESSDNQHLSNTEGLMESTIGDAENSGQKSHQENRDSHDGTGAGTCDVEEAKGLELANLGEGSPTRPVDVRTHHTDVEMTENVNISLEINIEKSPENWILNNNEEKQKGQLTSSIKDFTCNHFIEPQCGKGSESPIGADSAEATSAINSHSFIDNSGSTAKLESRETVDDTSASKVTHPCSLAVDHVDEDKGVLVHKEPMLEQESTQRFAPPVFVDNTTKDLEDDIENGFEKDEEVGDFDEDEKEGADGRVDDKRGISAEKDHVHKPEDKRCADAYSSDHVDEVPLDSSCHSMGLGENSGNAFSEDGKAGEIASPGRDRVTPDIQKKTHEEDPGNPEEAKAEVITETENVSEVPQLKHIVELTNSENFEKLLEKRDQCGQRDDIEADKIGRGDGVSEHKEQNLAELVEYDEAGCLKNIVDEHGVPSAHDPSERISTAMLWDTKTNDSESSLEAADMQRTTSVSPDAAGKFSQGKITESEYSSSSFSFIHLSPIKADSVLEHQGLDNEIALGSVVEKASSPLLEVQKQDAGIGIGIEGDGEIHGTEIEVQQMERTPGTVQKDGSEVSKSCTEVDKIMDDLGGQPMAGKMGYKHNCVSIGEDMREKERHENCLGEGSQPFKPGQYNTGGSETLLSLSATPEVAAPGVVDDALPFLCTPVKGSCHEEQGEQLRNLFATPLGVSKWTEEKEKFSGNSEKTGSCEALAKDRIISLSEDGGISESIEAFNEDLQELLGDLFATPSNVSRTTEEKECFTGDSDKAGEALNIELLDVCNASPKNNKEIYDGDSSKCCQENEARNLFSTPINSTSDIENEISKHGAEMIEPPMSLEETVAIVGSGEVVLGKGSEYMTCIVEKTMMLTSDQGLNASPGVAWPEDQLRVLFATPVQSMDHRKEGETLSYGRKMAEDAMSSGTSVNDANAKVLKHFEPQELLGELECGSEKVIENITTLRKMAEDAMSSGSSVSAANDKVLKHFEPQELLGELECGSEKVIENSTTLAGDEGNIINEVLDEVKRDLAVNISTFSNFTVDVSENYEVSKEQMTTDLETTAMMTGIEFITGEKNEDEILSSGTISPHKGATDHHSKCIETTHVTSVNNLKEAGQFRVMMSRENVAVNLERNDDVLLMDIFDKSEAGILHSREVSSTSTVQENSVMPLHLADETKVGQHDVLAEETLKEDQPDFHLNVAEVELNAKEKAMNAVVSANEASCTYGSSIRSLESVDCGDQGNAATLLSNPLTEDDEVRKESDRKTSRNFNVDDNLVVRANAECNIRILEVLKEQATNIEEAPEKDGLVGVTSSQQLVMHTSDNRIQQEMIKACASPYDFHDTTPLAEDEPATVDAESQLLSGFEMNEIPAENEDNEMVMRPSITNSLCHHGKEAEEIKESSNHMLTGEQSVLSELQMKGKDADLSSNIFGASDLSLSEGHEVLKENEVAAAIREYIDSEPNENVNNSGAKNNIDELPNAAEMNVTQDDNFVEPQSRIDVKPSNDAGEIHKPSTEDELEGRQYTMERKEASSDLNTGRGLIAEETLLFERLDAVAEEGKRFSAMERSSKMQNVRTILIHGTPLKADMKENAPASKREQMGILTTVRPAKRRALEDLTRK